MNRVKAAVYIGFIALFMLLALGSVIAQAGGRQSGDPLTKNIESLQVDQQDVREVLRSLMRRGGLAYSIAPEVQGEVTLSLRNVTLETALQNVLRQVDATYRIEGGVVNIIRRIGDVSGPDPYPNYLAGPDTSPAPAMVEDAQFLYILRNDRLAKVRKSDLRVVSTIRLPN